MIQSDEKVIRKSNMEVIWLYFRIIESSIKKDAFFMISIGQFFKKNQFSKKSLILVLDDICKL